MLQGFGRTIDVLEDVVAHFVACAWRFVQSPLCYASHHFVVGNRLLLLDLLRLLTCHSNGITPMHSAGRTAHVLGCLDTTVLTRTVDDEPSTVSHSVFITVGTTEDDLDVSLCSIVRTKQARMYSLSSTVHTFPFPI